MARRKRKSKPKPKPKTRARRPHPRRRVRRKARAGRKSRRVSRRPARPPRRKPARKKTKVTRTGHSKRTAGIGPKQRKALARRFSVALKKRGKKQRARRSRIEKQTRATIDAYIKKHYYSWEQGREGKPPTKAEMKALRSRVQPQTAVRKKGKQVFWKGIGWDADKKKWRDAKTGKTYTRKQMQKRWERINAEQELQFIIKVTGVSKREAKAIRDQFGGFPAGDFRRTPRWYE